MLPNHFVGCSNRENIFFSGLHSILKIFCIVQSFLREVVLFNFRFSMYIYFKINNFRFSIWLFFTSITLDFHQKWLLLVIIEIQSNFQVRTAIFIKIEAKLKFLRPKNVKSTKMIQKWCNVGQLNANWFLSFLHFSALKTWVLLRFWWKLLRVPGDCSEFPK